MKTTRRTWRASEIESARAQIEEALAVLPEWVRDAIIYDRAIGAAWTQAEFFVVAERLEWLYDGRRGLTENDPIVLGIETALTIAERAAAGPEEDEGQ